MSAALDLLLVRHGNTFAPGEKIVWAGARTDLPLVALGREQAMQLGQNLKAARYKAAHILTGPLLRTRQHAALLAEYISAPNNAIEIDKALCEIDYGAWEGLTTQEIHMRGGKAELDAWDTRAQWPKAPGWSPSKEEIDTATRTFLSNITQRLDGNAKAITVTSNGILRFFAQHCENPPTRDMLKVRTGHYCQLHFKNNVWHITSWNQSPQTPLAPPRNP